MHQYEVEAEAARRWWMVGKAYVCEEWRCRLGVLYQLQGKGGAVGGGWCEKGVVEMV